MTGLITHDWIEETGGAEKVLEQISAVFPNTHISCLWTDAPTRFPSDKVYESWMSHTPLRNHKVASVALATPTWRFRRRPQNVDWVLASSHQFAHQIKVPKGTVKLGYIYTPARYIWVPELDQRGKGAVSRLASSLLRPADRHFARELDGIATISRFVQDRVYSAWRRGSDVIYPPVSVAEITAENIVPADKRLQSHELEIISKLPADYILGASRFIPYKRLDLVIEVAESLGIPAVIAGRGPLERSIRERARWSNVEVEIIVSPSDVLLRELYRRALVFVFPPIEDFGIMPIEAQAAGTPVVTGPIGGARETLSEGETGFASDSYSIHDFSRAVRRSIVLDRTATSTAVQRFDVSRFRSELYNWVREYVGTP